LTNPVSVEAQTTGRMIPSMADDGIQANVSTQW